METYKLGNRIECIIRSYAAGKIGNQTMLFANQPYTTIKDVEASLGFNSQDVNLKSKFNELSFNIDTLSNVTISNVELNDKILNLIFSPVKENLIHTKVNCNLYEGKIDFTEAFNYTDADEIYQVFVYNLKGELIAATGQIDNSETLLLENFEQVYDKEYNNNCLVFYSYLGEKGFNLSRTQNVYLTLDLIITGNEDDLTNESCIHIDKCAINVDKNMYFNTVLNAVDLTFTVIDNGNSYITLK